MTLLVGPKVGLLISAQPGEAHFAQLTRLLRGIDGLLAGVRVISRVATLPGVFANGDMYLVTSGANANKIARYSIDAQSFSGWEYFTPWDGLQLWSSADQMRYRYNASTSEWVEESSGGGGGMSNPMTTLGDIIVGGASGAPTRLARGTTGQSIRVKADGTLEWYTPSGGGSSGTPVNEQSGSSYTLVADDAFKMVAMTSAAANTVVVPLEADVAFAENTRIDFSQDGAGKLTIAGASGTVIIRSTETLSLRKQWSMASLIRRAANVWQLTGDLERLP